MVAFCSIVTFGIFAIARYIAAAFSGGMSGPYFMYHWIAPYTATSSSVPGGQLGWQIDRA